MNVKIATQMNGMKKAITQAAYYLKGPMINLLFYCHIILYWEKVTSFDTYSHGFTIEAQIPKFQHSMLLMEVSKCWKIDEFSKVSINMKNFKTFYDAQTASHHNPFVPIAPFLFPWKNQKNLRFFDVFRGAEKGCIGNEWLNEFCPLSKNPLNHVFNTQYQAAFIYFIFIYIISFKISFPSFSRHQIKASYAFGIKIFLLRYTAISKYLLFKSFENAVLGCLEMLQWVFWHKLETFVKWMDFWLCCGNIIFIMLSALRFVQ